MNLSQSSNTDRPVPGTPGGAPSADQPPVSASNNREPIELTPSDQKITASITSVAKELIGYRTVRSADTEDSRRAIDEALKRVTDFFFGTSYHVHEVEHNGVKSLVISARARTVEDILRLKFRRAFLAHIDVVKSTLSDGYQAVEEGNVLKGRGAIDNKGPAAALMSLFRNHNNDDLFEEDVLIITSDEEKGGHNGAGYVAKGLGLRAEVILCPDGGGCFVPCVEHKGVYQIKLTRKIEAPAAVPALAPGSATVDLVLESRGEESHGSRPYMGENAIWHNRDDRYNLEKFAAAFPGVRGISYTKPEAGDMVNSVPDHARITARVEYDPKVFSLDDFLTKAAHELQHSEIFPDDSAAENIPPAQEATEAIDALLEQAAAIERRFNRAGFENPMDISVNSATLHTEISPRTNQPTHLHMNIDIRYPASMDLEDLKQMHRTLQELTAGSLLTLGPQGEPLWVDQTRDEFRMFLEVLQKNKDVLKIFEPETEFGHPELGVMRATGSSDARHFAQLVRDLGSTILLIKVKGSAFHAPGEREWVDKRSLLALYRLFEEFAQKHNEYCDRRSVLPPTPEEVEADIEQQNIGINLTNIRVEQDRLMVPQEVLDFYRIRALSQLEEDTHNDCRPEFVLSEQNGQVIGGFRVLKRINCTARGGFAVEEAYKFSELAKLAEMNIPELEHSVYCIDRAFIVEDLRGAPYHLFKKMIATAEEKILSGEETGPKVLVAAISPTNYISRAAFESVGFEAYTQHSDSGKVHISYYKVIKKSEDAPAEIAV